MEGIIDFRGGKSLCVRHKLNFDDHDVLEDGHAVLVSRAKHIRCLRRVRVLWSNWRTGDSTELSWNEHETTEGQALMGEHGEDAKTNCVR